MAGDANLGCWSCGSFEMYLEKTESFTGALTEALQGPMLALFVPLVGGWIVVMGIRLLLEPGAVKGQIARDLFLLLIASILLGGQANGLITDAYKASLAIIGGAASTAFEVAGGTPNPSYEGISGLLAAMESAVEDVFAAAGAIFDEGGWTDLQPIFVAGLVVLPFIFLIIIYLAHVIVCLFRIVSITAMAPILALFLGFSWGRQMAIAGVKSVIGSGLILYTATLAIALAAYGVTELNLTEAAQGEVAKFAQLTNPETLIVISMGFLGIAMMAEANNMANMISGLFLQNAGASSIVSPFAKGGEMAKKLTGMGAQAAGKGARYLGRSATDAGQRALDRHRDINNS